MKRRGFLAMLGLAAAVPAAAKLSAVEVKRTHPIVGVASYQCCKCSSSLRIEPILTRDAVLTILRERAPVIASCDHCGIRMYVPVMYAQCEVLDERPR